MGDNMKQIIEKLLQVSEEFRDSLSSEMVDNWFLFRKEKDDMIIVEYRGKNTSRLKTSVENNWQVAKERMNVAWDGDPFIGAGVAIPSWFYIYKVLKDADGNPIEGVCHIIDLTQWEQDKSMIAVANLQGEFKYASPQFLKELGYGTLYNVSLISILHEDDVAEVITSIDALVEGKTPKFAYYKHRTSNGKYKKFFGVFIPILSPYLKRVIAVLAIHNLSESKKSI